MTNEIWLEPISGDSPCGPNLEDDLDFLSLEEAAREKRSEEFRKDGGDAILIQGSSVNWDTVQSLAEALLGRSKDLRVAVYLCRALLHNEGFVGGVKGLALIEALLETFWDGLHPELDAAVIYYGQLETDPAKLGAIKAHVLGLFGDRDQGIPPAKVDAFEAGLRAAKVDAKILRFDAEHAFANPSGAHYDQASATAAWAEVEAFLAENLRR